MTSNLTNGKIKEYYYNAQNKLVKITGSNFVYEFSYDSQNRRIGIGNGTNDSSLIWRYTIHDGNLPIGEITVAPFYTDVSRWFVRGVGIAEGTGDMIADMILEYPTGMKSVFYLSNHRGDTMIAYRDDNGTEKCVATYQYDAFGNFIWKYYKSVIIEGQYAPRFLFSTKEFLFNADLYLYAYRVYDPIAGRWTQRDPIDYQDSINLYQFCGNNPVNLTDADGRMLTAGAATACGTFFGALTGAAIGAWKAESGHKFAGALKGGAKGALTGLAVGLAIDTAGASAVVTIGVAGFVAGAAGEAVDQGTQGKLGTAAGGLRVMGAGLGAAVAGPISGMIGNQIGSAIVGATVGEATSIGTGEAFASVLDASDNLFDEANKIMDDAKEKGN